MKYLFSAFIMFFLSTSQSTNSLFRHTGLPIEDYLCPVLQGCTVSVTGLSSTERKEVQRLCEQHGANYTGQLKMNECTHLIVSEPSGKLLVYFKTCHGKICYLLCHFEIATQGKIILYY